jgi:hypothetical protein
MVVLGPCVPSFIHTSPSTYAKKEAKRMFFFPLLLTFGINRTPFIPWSLVFVGIVHCLYHLFYPLKNLQFRALSIHNPTNRFLCIHSAMS